MNRILFTNACIYPEADGSGFYRHLLVENGKVAALLNSLPEHVDADIADMGGNCIIPSLTDCHTHSFEGGLYALCSDLSGCRSIDDALDQLRGAEELEGCIYGWSFQADKVQERRLPDMRELDSVRSDVPVIVRRIDGHSCMINSCAFRRIFRTDPVNVPAASEGFTTERNHIIIHSFQDRLSEQAIEKAYHQAVQIALGQGIGRIHTMVSDGSGGPGHFGFISEKAADFPVDFDFYPQIFNVETAVRLGSPRIGGCILADGSFGSRTAALSEDYRDKPGRRGVLRQSDAFWRDMYAGAEAAGLDLCVHAIGDAAIGQLLRAALDAGVRTGNGRRHQLIHNELLPDKLLPQLEKSGHMAVMQPAFDLFWGGKNGLYEQALGSRVGVTNRFRTLLDHGIRIAGGSDWYITPLDAMSGIYAAENHHNPAERVKREEALAFYTSEAAWAGRHEHLEGKLMPGFNADFIVLDGDFFGVEDVRDLKVVSHYRMGRSLYTEI